MCIYGNLSWFNLRNVKLKNNLFEEFVGTKTVVYLHDPCISLLSSSVKHQSFMYSNFRVQSDLPTMNDACMWHFSDLMAILGWSGSIWCWMYLIFSLHTAVLKVFWITVSTQVLAEGLLWCRVNTMNWGVFTCNYFWLGRQAQGHW